MKAETEHLRAQLGIEVTPDTEDSDLIHIRASDESIDRYGEIITAAGWRLDHYQRNPIIQNAHQYGHIMFTIGRAEKTLVSQNALLQTWRFASAANPFAKVARDLYRGGFLRAASVGFLPLRWEDGTEKSAFRRKYLEQELLEVSAVSIPANPNALTLAYNQGAVAKCDLRELYERNFGALAVQAALPRAPHSISALCRIAPIMLAWASGKSSRTRLCRPKPISPQIFSSGSVSTRACDSQTFATATASAVQILVRVPKTFQEAFAKSRNAFAQSSVLHSFHHCGRSFHVLGSAQHSRGRSCSADMQNRWKKSVGCSAASKSRRKVQAFA